MLTSIGSDHAQTSPTIPVEAGSSLDFLWMELTNRCNLECVHCYAESSPRGADSTLSAQQQAELLSEAKNLGCRRVQFIGGEPTLNRALPFLIAHARSLDFEFIEVYTNLVSLSEELLDCFQHHNVHVATSVYSSRSAIHDAVTTKPGSWERTAKNIRRLVERSVPIRASIIEMDLNRGEASSTEEWLRGLGVTDFGSDRLRHFGRGTSHDCQMSELCGNCAAGTLCIGPDGVVSPCIMSKAWSVGSLTTDSLSSIVSSTLLRTTRQAIHDATSIDTAYSMGGCQPDSKNPCNPDCGPSRNCNPCSPNANCGPNDCQPKRRK